LLPTAHGFELVAQGIRHAIQVSYPGSPGRAVVIPTLIVLGLVIGRWWRLAMIVGTAGWPAVLLAGGVVRTGPELLAATGLAAINTGVGVLLHQCGLRVVRLLRHHGAPKAALTGQDRKL
jgi:hypothetical protein